MSAEDYDQAEKIFCGTWKLTSPFEDEKYEEFMTAAGMSEEFKNLARKEKTFTITRAGNSFLEKTTVDGVDYTMTTKLNEELEWKDKEENPTIHIKTTPSFKDGVWHQEVISLNDAGGKKQVIDSTVKGDELIAELSLPEVPGVVAKRVYTRV